MEKQLFSKTNKLSCSSYSQLLIRKCGGCPSPRNCKECQRNNIERDLYCITAKKHWAVSFSLLIWALVFALLIHLNVIALGFENLSPRCFSFLELIKLSCAIIIYLREKGCDIVHKSKTISFCA